MKPIYRLASYFRSTTSHWQPGFLAAGPVVNHELLSAGFPTVLNGTNSSVTDSSSNVWTVVGGVAYENGSPAGFTADVAKLSLVRGTVWVVNTSSQWYFWNGSSWTAGSDPGTGSQAANLSTAYIPAALTHHLLLVVGGTPFSPDFSQAFTGDGSPNVAALVTSVSRSAHTEVLSAQSPGSQSMRTRTCF